MKNSLSPGDFFISLLNSAIKFCSFKFTSKTELTKTILKIPVILTDGRETELHCSDYFKFNEESNVWELFHSAASCYYGVKGGYRNHGFSFLVVNEEGEIQEHIYPKQISTYGEPKSSQQKAIGKVVTTKFLGILPIDQYSIARRADAE